MLVGEPEVSMGDSIDDVSKQIDISEKRKKILPEVIVVDAIDENRNTGEEE